MSVRWPVEYQVRNLKMENIIQKIREIYPVSDEALQALQANMELRYYPKDTQGRRIIFFTILQLVFYFYIIDY